MKAYSLSPNGITQFYRKEFTIDPPKSKIKYEISENSKENLKKERSINELSSGARKNLKKKINWLTFLSEQRKIRVNNKIVLNKFNVGFITLHLPSSIDGDVMDLKSRSLNNFFNILRKDYGLKNYVWVLELQQNGNPHFHVSIDKYIHWGVIRRVWNQSIELLGLVTKYQEKFSKMTFKEYSELRMGEKGITKEKIKKGWKYGRDSNWSNPNSTDIHSLRKVKNAAAYMAKYMAKKGKEKNSKEFLEAQEKLSGRLWYCSQGLSKLKNVVIESTYEMISDFRELKSCAGIYEVVDEFFHYIGFNFKEISERLRNKWLNLLYLMAHKSNYQFPHVNPF